MKQLELFTCWALSVRFYCDRYIIYKGEHGLVIEVKE